MWNFNICDFHQTRSCHGNAFRITDSWWTEYANHHLFPYRNLIMRRIDVLIDISLKKLSICQWSEASWRGVSLTKCLAVQSSATGGKSMGGWEGGIRVVGVAKLPGVIPAGQDIPVPTSQMDLFATIADLAEVQVPQDRVIDGRSMMPLLTGKSKDTTHEVLIHHCGTAIHAARYAPKGSKLWLFQIRSNTNEKTSACLYSAKIWCYIGVPSMLKHLAT